MAQKASFSVRHENGRVIVKAACPLAPSAADLDLELNGSCTSLELQSESGAYASQTIELPVAVLQDDMQCQWDRATGVRVMPRYTLKRSVCVCRCSPSQC